MTGLGDYWFIPLSHGMSIRLDSDSRGSVIGRQLGREEADQPEARARL